MNETFVDKKATVYDITTMRVDSAEIPTKNTIYTLAPCDFGKPIKNRNYMESNVVSNDKEEMEVVFNRWYENVRKGMYIDLFESFNGTDVAVWTYIIQTVDFVKDWNGIIDNIYLSCSQVNGQTN